MTQTQNIEQIVTPLPDLGARDPIVTIPENPHFGTPLPPVQTPNQPDLQGRVADFFEELKGDNEIQAHLARNPQYAKVLEEKVRSAYAKYESNLAPLSGKLNTALKGLGIAGDAYFLYDPIGGLGIKAISTIGRTAVELPNLVSYVSKSGDYLALGAFALMKAASYLPFATIADLGVTTLVARKIRAEAKQNFLKEIGVPQKSYFENLKEVYTAVQDRAANIFRPDYQPVPALA